MIPLLGRRGVKMRLKRFFIISVIITLIFSPGCAKKATVPDELVGVWKTADPKYPDPCFFELTKERIIFGTIEGTVENYLIKSISKEKAKTETRFLYTISYLDNNKLQYDFPVYYHPLEKGIIRFKNQQNIVWTKEKR